MYLLKRLTIIIFLFTIASCSGIESHQVKLKDFKKPTEEQIKKLDLQYNNAFFMEYQYNNYKVKHKEPKSKNPPKCLANSLVGDTNKLLTCPLPTNIIAPITLYIIPYYCAAHYTADAGLLFKTDKIDSDGDPIYEVVKQFELKDKVHELWSFFYVPPALFGIEPVPPKVAKSRTHHRISEAMVRQVINEALSRKECYINEKDYYEYIAKKQQQEKEELEKKQKEEELRRKNSWWRF